MVSARFPFSLIRSVLDRPLRTCLERVGRSQAYRVLTRDEGGSPGSHPLVDAGRRGRRRSGAFSVAGQLTQDLPVVADELSELELASRVEVL